MTVSKLVLPVDFGLEELYQPNNNNASFILADGKRFEASSLMLGLHSPVLKEKYIQEGILEIEVEDFSYETVKTFVEAMYCGHLDITRDNFREVNKICHVYNVTWMSVKCAEYFEERFEDVNQEDLKFLFGEAVYLCENGRSVSLMEIWKRKTEETNSDMFIQEYLMSKSLISDFTLDTLLGLQSNHVVFLDYIRGRISGNLPNLDNTSKFLFLNMNLVQCFEHHTELTTEIFDILLDNEESADWRMLNSLYRKVSKEFMIARKSEEKPPGSTVAVCNQRIPNLFHEYGKVKRVATVEMTIDNAASISSSLFMVLEFVNRCVPTVTDSALCMTHYGMHITNSVLEKLVELRRENSWTRVHPEFVDSFMYMPAGDSNKLKNCADITSSTHSVRVVCDKVTTMWNFLTISATYSFKMRLPGQPACRFLIDVTSGSSVNQEQFDVQLVGDTNRNPTDMHLADKLHLVVEVQFNNKWKNWYISWNGRPVYRYNGGVSWVGCTWSARNRYPARLVAYYSVGGGVTRGT